MSLSLEEALAQVDLEAGKVYSCQVKGRTVVVRVLPEPPLGGPIAINEDDMMREAWTELPPLEATGSLIVATPGELPPPELLIIPDDEEQ